MPDFLPLRENELVSWTANFAQKLEELGAEFGIPPERIADYQIRQSHFASLHQASVGNGTRTPQVLAEKQTARDELKVATRKLARCLRGCELGTGPALVTFGLRPRAGKRRAIGVPSEPPTVAVYSGQGRMIEVRLSDRSNPARRGLPVDVVGARIMTHVGDHPPESPDGWKLERTVTRAISRLEPGQPHPFGTRVWVIAAWVNAKGEPGPLSEPKSVRVTSEGMTTTQMRAA